MLASAGSVGKAACEDREIPPGPPFAKGGDCYPPLLQRGKIAALPFCKGGRWLPPFFRRGRLDFPPPFFRGGSSDPSPRLHEERLDLASRCFKGGARVPRSASSERVADSP